jgi:peptidoglycan/xylan/chitin deacetylase (PgdA/CDA1 family)
MGLMDQTNHLGEHFSRGDLERLLDDGHELGSHTFSHISCRTASPGEAEAEVIRGRHAVEEVTGVKKSHHFSYPYGHATIRTKARVGPMVTSCRGILPGINTSPVDLNLLKANSLYSHSLDLAAISRLIEANERCRGWLIFYTHDIGDRPSQFGCTPDEFETVLKLAVASRARILPVGQCTGRRECGSLT